jgi:metal-sulfur cluster biosynthetic enzyme
MDMWTTQERCPHAHSLKQQIQKADHKVESAKD